MGDVDGEDGENDRRKFLREEGDWSLISPERFTHISVYYSTNVVHLYCLVSQRRLYR